MKLFEYQAKDAFESRGIPVPKRRLCDSPDDVFSAAMDLGCPCVVKSQVLQGGRGKAGLVRPMATAADARAYAEQLLNGPLGSRHGVKKVLVEEAIDIERELYLSITVDPEAATALILACADGGVDIEELASTAPGKIFREKVDLGTGLLAFQARDLAYSLGLEQSLNAGFVSILTGLYKSFRDMDAELVEINPLFVTSDCRLVAGDGKLVIDDNSAFRQGGAKPSREYFDSDVAFEAALEGIPYLQFDGDISLMCAGAGLTTVVYDLVNYEGGSVANYLEFGGPNYRKAVRAMELCLKNEPGVILIVTFGTIARADVMAEGIAEAIAKLKPSCPIVACIRGTGEEDAVRILKAAGLEPLFDTEEAVRKAVALSKASKAGTAGGRA
ncbi:MAG: succinate--CoA ligase subunit beta [Spirochaetia bacterium]|jgi:succinyl-CoA synthetase beta subunit|nr:succinate--CoA ligase subunit beta [Spirochaetia bacterium]